jgi:hypothetical protein
MPDLTDKVARRGLLLVMLDIDSEVDEEEFHRWYFEEHVAERMACPGFRCARRFEAVEGKPRYLAIYDLDGPEALDTAEYRRLAHSPLIGNFVDDPIGSERTTQMLGAFRNVVRNVYVEIDPGDHGFDERGAPLP